MGLDLSKIIPTTLNSRQSERYATQKHEITPRVLDRQARKKSNDEQDRAFRDAVWKRDGSKCRATGVALVRSGTIDPEKLGEVDHAYLRSTSPELIYDVGNGILLQKHLNRLRKFVCPEAPESKLFDYTGPDDRGQPQTFIWRDRTGKITKRRTG